MSKVEVEKKPEYKLEVDSKEEKKVVEKVEAPEEKEQTFSRIDRALKREKTIKNFWSSNSGKMLLTIPKHLIKFVIVIMFMAFAMMIHLIILEPHENFSTDIDVNRALGDKEF